MSALPIVEPIVEPAPRTKSGPATRTLPRFPEPVIIELPGLRPHRGRVKKVQARKRASTIFGQIASFLFLTGIAFSSFSLAGQVMVEKARRDGIRAAARAEETSRDIASLRSEVQDLASAHSIDDWANANGFVAPGTAPVTSAGAQANVAKHA